MIALAVLALGSGCGTSSSGEVSASGTRQTAPVESAGGGDDAAARPTMPAPATSSDEGVEVLVLPTPTVDAAPIDAAPAVLGAPIVVGVSPAGIEAPATIRAGEQTYQVVNTGAESHRFGIMDGDGADLASTDQFGPGESRSLLLDLAPGNYEMVCLEVGHVERGEVHGFAVAS